MCMKNTLQHNNKYKTTYQLIFTSALINIEILNLHLTEPKLSHPLNSRPNCGSPNLRHDDDGDDDDDDDDDDGDSDYVDDDDADVELYRASWRLVMLMITLSTCWQYFFSPYASPWGRRRCSKIVPGHPEYQNVFKPIQTLLKDFNTLYQAFQCGTFV